MSNTMEYKGYLGSVEFSEADGVFFGKVLGIRALLSCLSPLGESGLKCRWSCSPRVWQPCLSPRWESELKCVELTSLHPLNLTTRT